MSTLPAALFDLLGPILTALVFALHLAIAIRAITRPNREPAARIAWLVVIIAVPVIGLIAYLALGETNIGLRRVQRLRDAETSLGLSTSQPTIFHDPAAEAVSALAASINGFPSVTGNLVQLLGDPQAPASEPKRDSNSAMDALIHEIDSARDHVHITFYIWLDDINGGRVAEAVCRAAKRGVTCRIMADALGSRAFVRGPRWRQMREAGVHLEATLQDLPRLGKLAVGRVDLRNHRKIVVIDNRVAFCGSQNCADPEFRVKPKYAPWIDILLRCEGPVVRQAQYLFLAGWIAATGEDSLATLPAADPQAEAPSPGIDAQMFGTGPTTRGNAMSEVFVTTLYAAQRELVITTPYLVPDEAMFRALCAAPQRGVKTTLIVPANNDSPLVAAASHGIYSDLLAAGVQLYEYPLGLLHTKSITVDDHFALVGSANMDRRSLELNFENNLLVFDPAITGIIKERQLGYLSQSHPVTSADAHRSLGHRLVDNIAGMVAPLL